jgi:hypothetical protein
MASTSIDDLTPDTRERVLELLRLARQAGLEPRVVSTLRSCSDQAAIYARGRSSPGSVVSWAKGCRSWQVWGRAADILLFEGGKMLAGSDPRYVALGEFARQAGLSQPLPTSDPGHFQHAAGMAIGTLCPDPGACEQALTGAPLPVPDTRTPAEEVDEEARPPSRGWAVAAGLAMFVAAGVAIWRGR